MNIPIKETIPAARHMKIVELHTQGYTETHVFLGEYVLLVNPTNRNKIRLYEDGSMWESNVNTGWEHRKVED